MIYFLLVYGFVGILASFYFKYRKTRYENDRDLGVFYMLIVLWPLAVAVHAYGYIEEKLEKIALHKINPMYYVQNLALKHREYDRLSEEEKRRREFYKGVRKVLK